MRQPSIKVFRSLVTYLSSDGHYFSKCFTKSFPTTNVICLKYDPFSQRFHVHNQSLEHYNNNNKFNNNNSNNNNGRDGSCFMCCGLLPQMRETHMVCNYKVTNFKSILNLQQMPYSAEKTLPVPRSDEKRLPLQCHGRDSNLRPPVPHDKYHVSIVPHSTHEAAEESNEERY